MSHRTAGVSGAVVLLLVAAGADPGALATGRSAPASAAPTRADLDALRRRVALLESELALGKSRKPYCVLDASQNRLRVALLGLTVRDIPLGSVEIDGLLRTDKGIVPALPGLTGIVTLREKEDDPRLKPLTTAEIEAGATDENVADALPPEAPAGYELRFSQPVLAVVEGTTETRTVWSKMTGWWRHLRSGAGKEDGRLVLGVAVHMDETAAREIYRSLHPGERMMIVPPGGSFLPDCGQEPPRSIRPARPVTPPSPPPGPPPPGVPFRIPSPVESAGGNGLAQEKGGGPAGGNAPEFGPAPDATPGPGGGEAPPGTEPPGPGPSRTAPQPHSHLGGA